MTTTAPLTATVIARITPVRERRRVLDQLPREALVAVEYGGVTRTLDDPNVSTVVGYVLGSAYSPGGNSSDALIVRPYARNYRLVSIPAAQVLRVRYAAPKANVPGSYYLGPAIAGPAVTDTDPQEV